MTLIPLAPIEPSSRWLASFTVRLMTIKPGLQKDTAIRCGRFAYPGTWLLEPDEAADLWAAAIEAAVREKMPRDLRG